VRKVGGLDISNFANLRLFLEPIGTLIIVTIILIYRILDLNHYALIVL
jgi:hypothetical protein